MMLWKELDTKVGVWEKEAAESFSHLWKECSNSNGMQT